MSKKWNIKNIPQLVEEYGKHPCLWDRKHAEYKNELAKGAALEAIAKAMDVERLDAEGVRRRVLILRSLYGLEKLEIAKSVIMGSSPDYKPESHWFWLADSFLKKVIKLEGHIISTEEQLPVEFNVALADEHVQLEDHCEDCHQPAISNATNTSNLTAPLSNSSEENEFDLFGKTLAFQLKQLRLEDALELKMKIKTLIFEQRLSLIRGQYSNPMA